LLEFVLKSNFIFSAMGSLLQP
jgi:hypothetical protein